MMKKLFCSRRWQALTLLLMLVLLTFYISLDGEESREPNLELTRRDEIIKHIENTLRENLKEDKGTGCKIPQLDPFSDEVMKFNNDGRKITCKGQDWVKCKHAECRVNPEILSSLADVVCYYQDIIHKSDASRFLGTSTEVMGADVYTLTKSDHVAVTCTGWNPSNYITERWKGYSIGFRKTTPLPPPKGREDTLNVLILGFDSTAKNGFIRRMPKSYKFVTEEMKATILNGYNTVGDGTPASLFPILTGKTELELPDVRKQSLPKKTLDDMPFIFYKLKTDGYRTAYFEDMPWIGTFQYRFNGFKKQPADHYLRSFFLEETHDGKRWWSGTKKYCVGDTPRFKLMLNITEQFLEFPEKKYIFTFIADITHDNFNLISNADEELLRFMKKFLQDKRNENTLFLLMGDHGPRYADVRQTIQGKLEERLPLMAILLPDQLLAKRPQALRYLKENAEVLTTPHDIHATVLDAIGMRQHWNHYKIEGADLKRGLTLLEPIPSNRSCSEAGIEPHWCSCLSWENVSIADDMYYKTANALVDYMNSLTEVVRSLCVKRKLSSIEWINVHKPKQGVLHFKGAKDSDGYIGEFNKNYKQDTVTYQIKITISPGNGVYEASLKYITATEKFVIHSRDISRTNAYNDEPQCISANYPHLNMFCYCQK